VQRELARPSGRSVISGLHPLPAIGEIGMPHPDEDTPSPSIPAWALRRATEELHDVDDPEVILQHAGQIAREAQEREDERHDEYDDPDQGGEA
jgi:hypothetical protein